MASMLVTHHVKDFPAFKKIFDSVIDMRKSNGERSAQIFHDSNDPNNLTLLFGWTSIADAQKYAHSPELRAAMEKAGVDSPPAITFLNED